MTLENTIRMIAGTFVLASLALGFWIDAAWLLFTAFVGFNLVQSSVTGFCPAEILLKHTVFKNNNIDANREVTLS